jgi:hypothetical protein
VVVSERSILTWLGYHEARIHFNTAGIIVCDDKKWQMFKYLRSGAACFQHVRTRLSSGNAAGICIVAATSARQVQNI